MLIKNAKLRNLNHSVDILIEGDVIKEISPSIISSDSNIINANNNLVLEPFIEPHVHLDTALSAGQPRWNKSGTLFEGIECWSEKKETLTYDDVKKRSKKALEWQIANGIQWVRTHVDITDPTFTALKVLLELKEEMKQFVNIQIVAFPQEGILSFPNGLKLLEDALILGADVIGGIPHFEYTRDLGVQSIKEIVKLAIKYDKLIDVHCDEIDDEQSRFLEVLATEALFNNIGTKVTASHTTAMGSYNDPYTYKLFRLLRKSNINFISNPLVNIHLGGRFDSYPKRRGLTRVKELDQDNINVCFGHDDIFDPWYPLGNGNMLQVLHMGLHVSHMMGYDDISNCLDFITCNSAKTLHLGDEYKLKVGNKANLIILSEQNDYDAVKLQASVLFSIKNGVVISKSTPKQSYIFTTNKKFIDFK